MCILICKLSLKLLRCRVSCSLRILLSALTTIRRSYKNAAIYHYHLLHGSGGGGGGGDVLLPNLHLLIL